MIVISKHDHSSLFGQSKGLLTLARKLLQNAEDRSLLNEIKVELQSFDKHLLSCIDQGVSERLKERAEGKRGQFRASVSQCLRGVLAGEDVDFSALVDSLKQLLQCFCLPRAATAAGAGNQTSKQRHSGKSSSADASAVHRRNPTSPRRAAPQQQQQQPPDALVAAVGALLKAALDKRAAREMNTLTAQVKRRFASRRTGPFASRLSAFETLVLSECKLIAREGATSTNIQEVKQLLAHLKLLVSASPVVSSSSPPPSSVVSPRDSSSSSEEDASPGAKLRRLYGWHFPELDRLIPSDDRQYAQVVLCMGDREKWLEAPYTNGKALEEKMRWAAATVEQLVHLARGSMGSDITQEELADVKRIARMIVR